MNIEFGGRGIITEIIGNKIMEIQIMILASTMSRCRQTTKYLIRSRRESLTRYSNSDIVRFKIHTGPVLVCTSYQVPSG